MKHQRDIIANMHVTCYVDHFSCDIHVTLMDTATHQKYKFVYDLSFMANGNSPHSSMDLCMQYGQLAKNELRELWNA